VPVTFKAQSISFLSSADRWALNVTGTSEFRHRSINDLSGGQRQRVWIAMALAQKKNNVCFLSQCHCNPNSLTLTTT
jgi:ABC-type cobalamin/Fe3+-siderophores transport system ATPase subunit